MEINKWKPRKALNKAFLKVKPNRTEMEGFKANLAQLLDRTNNTESEEFHKNLVIDFLKNTYYTPSHFVNTKGRNDLVIHNGDQAKSSVGVIVEAKKPTNKSEMVTTEKMNAKAFQELVLYYLRERIAQKNLETKHLIITNIKEWFIFDATTFDRLFAQNKKLVKQFEDFEGGRLADTKTDFFYKEIAAPFIEKLDGTIEFTHFDLREYDKPLRNDNPKDDNKLIALFKLLSPEHLLKLPFANDSNSLDKKFYSEWLHILGLTETKDKGKKIIQRNKPGERNTGSLLENAVVQLEASDKIRRLENPSQYGETVEDRLFHVGLELSITWANRMLFLKLLEAQLIACHKGDTSYSFLNFKKIKNYGDLNSLFFQVLAKKHNERNEEAKEEFEKVPYLNSSLFEPNELERSTILISNLRDEKKLPIHPSTVLKDENGKKQSGEWNALEYLFAFLEAYDFGSEGSEEIQEENKSLINASVLGLIFEKINGYKDGSFFTPGFVTMYMCRETIRKAVVQKFNETKGWKCKNFEELKEDVQNAIREGDRKAVRKEANDIVNGLKICDPAVGSGHFLVSALNEILAIKGELKILVDKNHEPISTHKVEVINDELVLSDLEDALFEYVHTNKEAQRVQKTLFHEKQTIIENCLFGVDINPNSVKICRLRLWIELLKSAYYKNETELETLPNIDINIKCGNSLISRFDLDADVKKALKASKWTIDSYRIAVDTYRNAQNKEEKHEMERLIHGIKSDFRSEISKNNPIQKKLDRLGEELFNLTGRSRFGTGFMLFEPEGEYGNEKGEKKRKEKIARIEKDIEKCTQQLEELKNDKIYENAFEWRFEFPEVLNDDGDFVGFDVVIGNPPYIQLQAMKEISEQLKRFEYKTYEKTGDIYSLFYEKGNSLLKQNGHLAYITSNKWMRAGYGKTTRNYFLQYTQPELLIDLGSGVFEEATVDSNVLILKKTPFIGAFNALDISKEKQAQNFDAFKNSFLKINPKPNEIWTIASEIEQGIKAKIERIGKPLKEWDINIYRGVLTGYNQAFIINGEKKDELIAHDPKSAEIIKPILRGRDIKRYKAEFADLWLIATFPALKLDIDDYPAVKLYLQSFGKRLNQTGEEFTDENGQKAKSRKKTGNKWFETQDQIGYYQEFEKEKIVYAETTQEASFIFDNKKFFADKTSFIITGENIKYLASILASRIVSSYYKTYCGGTILGEKGYQYNKHAVEKIPIPPLSENEQQPFIVLVEEILEKKGRGENTTAIEDQIDQMVYELYGLTEAEIAVIEERVK